jgi:hypothetical protein
MTKRVPFIVTEHAVYFPTNGMISLVAVTAGGSRRGKRTNGQRGYGQCVRSCVYSTRFWRGGCSGRRPRNDIDRRAHADDCATNAPVLATISRAHAALMAQARQSAAGNATHPLEARLAKWLLQTRDRVDSNTLPLTQEFVAIMLGVQRTSVNTTIRTLGALKLIEQRRGSIEITNPKGLKDAACDLWHCQRVRCPPERRG